MLISINHHHKVFDAPESLFWIGKCDWGCVWGVGVDGGCWDAGWLAKGSCIHDITVCGCFVGNINLGGQSVRVALRT